MPSRTMIRLMCTVGALSFTGAPVQGCEASWFDCSPVACYHFHTCFKPFIEARDICNNSGAALTSIRSLEERTFLANSIRNGMLTHGTFDNNFLVGGYRTTTTSDFTWLDESAFIFQGEITSPGNDLCLKYIGKPDDKLLATACDSYNQFLCKNGSATPLLVSSLSSGFSTLEASASPTAYLLSTSSVLPLSITSEIEISASSSSFDSTVFHTFGVSASLEEVLPSVDVSKTDSVQLTSTLGLAALVSVSTEFTVPTKMAVQTPSPVTSDPTVISFASEYPYRTNLCFCGCKGTLLSSLNVTNPEVQLFLETKFKKKKLTTADDPRPSARGIGGGAVVLLVVGFVLIVIMDASKLVKDLSLMYDNIRGREPRSRNKQKRRA